MKRASVWTSAGALLLLASFATPLHLALEAHEWHHEEAGKDHRHDSESETHPAVDHELLALSRTVQVDLTVPVEPMAPDATLAEPEVRAWYPPIDLVSNGPPDSLQSPPRSPRAPPL